MIDIAISPIAMTRAHSKRPPVVNDDSGGLLCLLEAPMFEMGAALEQDARDDKGPCPAVQYRPRISWWDQSLAQDKRQLSLGLLAGVGRATAPWGCSQPQAQSNLCALVHLQPGKRFMRPGADAPQGSLHAIDHTPQSRTGKSELIRVRAIVVGLPLRNKAANRSLFMDHNQCPWVGVTAEKPVITVHRRRCPLEQPLGILFSHIDATAAHRRAEVAVPLFA